ncbi:MAG: PAS domain S-box protein [Nitrospirota bacterium]
MENKTEISFFKKQHLILLTAVISMLLIAGGVLYYRAEARAIRKEKYDELKAIASLKIGQITQWREERIADAGVLSQSPFFVRRIEQWLANPEDPSSKENILELLSHKQEEYYDNDIILSSPEGNLLLSLAHRTKKLDAFTSGKIIEAVHMQQVILTDFYLCSIDDKVHLDIIAPVVNEQRITISALVFSIDPDNYLYPIIQLWPTPSKTAETMLVRRDGESVLFLNELRHRKNTALQLRRALTEKDLPVVQAVQGFEGIIEGKDYRGIDVLADIRPVPETPWHMVTKVDRSEIFAKLRYRGTVTVLFIFLMLILTGTGIAWLYHSRQKNIYRELFLKERDLRIAQEEFRITLYSIGDAVITADTKGNLRHMNAVAEQLTGWKEHEAKGRPLQEIFRIMHEETREWLEDPVHKVLNEGTVIGLANDTLLVSRDGMEIPIANSCSPVRSEKGDIIAVVLVFRDQTEERAAQKVLQESEQRFRLFYEQSPAPYQSLDAEGRILDINNAWLETMGYARNEVIGKRFGDFLSGSSSSLFPERFSQFKSEGEIHGVEYEMKHKDGSTIIVSFEGSVSCNKKGDFLQTHCVFTNITEQKLAEEKIRESQRHLSTLIGNLPGIAYRCAYDRNWTMEYISEGCIELTGYQPEDFIGNKTLAFNDIIHPDYQEYLYEKWTKILSNKEVFTDEYPIITKDGKEKWVWEQGCGIYSEQGDVIALEGFITDVTERKQAEEEIRKLNEELEQRVEERTTALKAANRELEAFTYSVSHDLRAPLRAIDGFTQMLVRHLGADFDDEGKRVCSVIVESTKKMARLIDDLLALSRLGRTEMHFASIDMKTMAGEVFAELTTPEMQQRIDFALGDLPSADGDPALLRQVWTNLISNAVKFSAHRERASISVTSSKEEEKAVYCIQDNGAGFNMKYQNKLFGVFQRLHSEREFEGTGVGLAIVQRIIHRHGGEVWAKGEVDKGAEFCFSMPVKERKL